MKSTLIILALCATFYQGNSQTTSDKELKDLVRTETEYFLAGDTAKWAALYLQTDKLKWTYTGNGYIQLLSGWNNIAPPIINYMRSSASTKRPMRVEHSNYIIYKSGDLSTLSYNQKTFYTDKDSLPTANSYELRTLQRDKGKWKIVSLTTIDSLSYSSSDAAVMENIFNGAGYRYMEEKNFKDAIEVFKLNVSLHPNSWNAYDSLGEAYVAAENKEQAIKMYERSVELNPGNENGIATLKKLKGN